MPTEVSIRAALPPGSDRMPLTVVVWCRSGLIAGAALEAQTVCAGGEPQQQQGSRSVCSHSMLKRADASGVARGNRHEHAVVVMGG